MRTTGTHTLLLGHAIPLVDAQRDRTQPQLVQRLRLQLDEQSTGHRELDAELDRREAELRSAREAEQQAADAREKLSAQLKRSEEQARRLLGERDAAHAERAELRKELEARSILEAGRVTIVVER